MKVAVYGAGAMGSGIAQIFAQKGHTVYLYASSPASAQKHKDNLAASLEKQVAKGLARGKFDEAKAEQKRAANVATLANILIEDDSPLADVDLFLECIKEDMALKKELLHRVDDICKESCIFATNTSSLSITEMDQGLKHQLVGMHFFNPVPAMKLVEVIRGINTTDEAFQAIFDLSKELGKEPVEIKEAPGFVVNKLLIPMINDAIGLVETDAASIEDIDKSMKLGANHPMGPLELGDLIGLDVCLAIMTTLYEELGDSKYRPTYLLRKMVRGGKLGRKSGEGFYKYGKK